MAKSLGSIFGNARQLLKDANRYLEPVEDGVTVRLCGGIGSPYTNKMLAVLRYRRVPHRFVQMGSPEELGTVHPPVPKAAQRLLPKIVWPDDSATNDSTFLIEELEQKYRPGVRSLRPPHGGLAFLSDLLEDWADEWLTKSMYHYRWTHDPVFAGEMIALQQAVGPNAPPKMLDTVSSNVQQRQVSRRTVVGSNPGTYGEIEAGFGRFIELMDAHLVAGHRFLLGTRPSAADFAVFGQIHPMIRLDPNTSKSISDRSVRLCSWCVRCGRAGGAL